jgi:hypothetical protein
VYTTNTHHMQTHAHTHKSFLMTWSLILLSAVSSIHVYGEHLMHSPLWSFSDCELEVSLCFMFSKTTCVSPSFKICWHLAWTKKVSEEEGGGLSAHWIANWQSNLSHWQLVAPLLQQKLQIDSTQSWLHMMKLTCFPDVCYAKGKAMKIFSTHTATMKSFFTLGNGISLHHKQGIDFLQTYHILFTLIASEPLGRGIESLSESFLWGSLEWFLLLTYKESYLTCSPNKMFLAWCFLKLWMQLLAGVYR